LQFGPISAKIPTHRLQSEKLLTSPLNEQFPNTLDGRYSERTLPLNGQFPNTFDRRYLQENTFFERPVYEYLR